MFRKYALVVAAAAGLGLAALASTPAASLPASPGFVPTTESNIELAQWRRCHVRFNSRWVRCGYPGPYYRPYGPYYGPYPYGPYPYRPYWGPPRPFPFFFPF